MTPYPDPESFDALDPEDAQNPLDLPTTPPTPPAYTPVVLPAFLSAAELNTHIYTASVTAITDGDATILPNAIAAAISEAAGYMSLYDYVTLFGNTGTNRDPILLLYIKDLALWHFIILGNANINYEAALDRYRMAIRWLEKVADGRFVPVGWPPATQPNLATYFHLASQPKRSNNY
jgi:phage gp36-like protein